MISLLKATLKFNSFYILNLIRISKMFLIKNDEKSKKVFRDQSSLFIVNDLTKAKLRRSRNDFTKATLRTSTIHRNDFTKSILKHSRNDLTKALLRHSRNDFTKAVLRHSASFFRDKALPASSLENCKVTFG
jgi:hypothetical protein